MKNRMNAFFTPLCRSLRLLFLIISALLFLFSGCRLSDRYTYSNIINEQRDKIFANGSLSEGEAEKTVDKDTELIPDGNVNKPMTIQDVISVALKNNPDLKQARSGGQQARAMTDISKAAFWPSIGFYTEYMQGDAPSFYLFKAIDQRMLPSGANFNDPGWFENYESGLNARMNIFNSGRDYLSVQISKKGETVADLNYQALENLLIAQLIRSFYDVLTFRKFIEIARESVNSVSEQLRILQVRYDGGGALKSDVLSMEVRLARLQEQLLGSENRYKISISALINLMGLDPGVVGEQSFELEKSFLDIPFIPENFDDGLSYALNHRPEIARVHQQIIQSRMGVDLARAAYLPRLDVMMKYYVADPNMKYNIDRENWIAALIFNWEFFSGFATSASVKKADYVLEEMLAADQKEIQNITLDVKTAYLNRQEAESRYRVAVRSVDSAAESFRLVKNHYLGGSVPVTRFLEAELDLNRARIHATAAYFDREKSAADIARAIGLWSPPIISTK